MKLSKKFDVPSVYYDGRYYFPEDAEPLKKKDRYSIQVVYYSGKWRQDTSYISTEKYNKINSYYNKRMSQ